MRQYDIAGHIVQISGERFESLPGFESFAENCHCGLDPQSPEKVLLKIKGERLKVNGERYKVKGELYLSPFTFNLSPVFTSEYEGRGYDLSVNEDGVRLFRMMQKDAGCLSAEIRPEIDVFQASVGYKGVFDDFLLSYILWLLFGVAALSRQTVSIHAATVMHGGKSVLFLGESGTGKSTHARLWLNHIPDTELLNDDSPFLRVESDGGIRVYGSPWSGKTPCYKNLHTPVAAFVRLSQAPCNSIRRLTGIEALAALLPSCPLAFAYDKQLSESIYSILSRVLQQTPVYHLECLPDDAAARLVYETLKEDKRL